MDYYEAFNLMYRKITPLFGGSQLSDNQTFPITYFTNLPNNLLTSFLSAKENLLN